MKSTDHILWFFSTCAQTFAALVSVFGMFVLYRLQIEEGRIGALRERMLHYDDRHLKLPFEVVLKKIAEAQQAHHGAGELDHARTLRTLMADYEGAVGKRAWLSRRTRQPIIWLILLTFWSLVGLVLYPYYAGSIVGVVLIGITLLGSVLPLYQVGAIIIASITLE